MQTTQTNSIYDFKLDLRQSIMHYISICGDRLHQIREQDVLALQNMIQNGCSKPVLMRMIKVYLAQLSMPLCPYKLWLGFRTESKLRNGLNEVLMFHQQQSCIDRLKKKLKASEDNQKRIQVVHQENIQTLETKYQRKVALMAKALQEMQLKFEHFMLDMQAMSVDRSLSVQRMGNDAKHQVAPLKLGQGAMPVPKLTLQHKSPPLKILCEAKKKHNQSKAMKKR